MKKTLLAVASALATLSISPAFATVISFDEAPLPIGYSPLGTSFVNSGYQFSGSSFDRTLYNCDIFAGCRDAGIGFDSSASVRRIDGNAFSLNSIFIAGGLNYDGAAPRYTPGTVSISGITSRGSVLTFSQFLPAAGIVNVGLNDLVSFTLRYSPTLSSTRPLFDTLDVTAAAIPEPTSWAMLLVGFGMMGATMRYRRRSTRAAFA